MAIKKIITSTGWDYKNVSDKELKEKILIIVRERMRVRIGYIPTLLDEGFCIYATRDEIIRSLNQVESKILFTNLGLPFLPPQERHINNVIIIPSHI